jgi:hypothetical protein
MREVWNWMSLTLCNFLHKKSKRVYMQIKLLSLYSIFLIIKPTRCTNFPNLFLEWNSTCFGQFLCPSGEFFTVHTAMVYVIQVCWQLVSRSICSCSQAVSIGVCTVKNSPDDGQKNCPKNEEFHSKNKFGKLVHLVGFIIRNLARCTVTWTSNYTAY